MQSLNPVNWSSLPEDVLDSIETAKRGNGWNNVGIRIQDDVEFALGPIDHISRVWINGDETAEDLGGICAISASDIQALCKEAGHYPGNHVAIIAGDVCGYGEDPCEIILKNAEVWEVLA